MRAFKTRKIKGITLIEALISTIIIALSVSLAAPSFRTFMNTYNVKNIAETMYSDLRLAQSESVKRQVNVYFSMRTSNGGTTWCYGLRDNASCDCTASNSCMLNGVEKVVRSTGFQSSTVTETFFGNSLSFSYFRATLARNPGTITVTSGTASSTITINELGVVKIQ